MAGASLTSGSSFDQNPDTQLEHVQADTVFTHKGIGQAHAAAAVGGAATGLCARGRYGGGAQHGPPGAH